MTVLEVGELDGDAQHAQRLLRHLGIGFLDLLHVLRRDVADALTVHHLGAEGKKHIGRALDVRLLDAVVLVDGGHQLSHAVEGHFVHAGIGGDELVMIVAARLGVGDESGLGRIADEPFRGFLGVVAQRHRTQESLEVFPVGSSVFVNGLETAIRQIIALYGHLIES